MGIQSVVSGIRHLTKIIKKCFLLVQLIKRGMCMRKIIKNDNEFVLLLMHQFGKKLKKLFSQHYKYEDENFKIMSDFLIVKAIHTFNSIRLLITGGEEFMKDAYCLYRVLLENVIIYIYLSKYTENINDDFFSSEQITLNKLISKIFTDTKGLKYKYSPYRLIDVSMEKELKKISKKKKEMNNKYSKKYDNNFQRMVDKLKMDSLILPYNKGSNLIHSGWISKSSNSNNPEFMLYDISHGVCFIIYKMIEQICENTKNDKRKEIEEDCFLLLKKLTVVINKNCIV